MNHSLSLQALRVEEALAIYLMEKVHLTKNHIVARLVISNCKTHWGEVGHTTDPSVQGIQTMLNVQIHKMQPVNQILSDKPIIKY